VCSRGKPEDDPGHLCFTYQEPHDRERVLLEIATILDNSAQSRWLPKSCKCLKTALCPLESSRISRIRKDLIARGLRPAVVLGGDLNSPPFGPVRYLMGEVIGPDSDLWSNVVVVVVVVVPLDLFGFTVALFPARMA